MNKTDEQPIRTLEDAIGGKPTPAFLRAWASLHDCTEGELAYLRLDGLRAIQLSR